MNFALVPLLFALVPAQRTREALPDDLVAKLKDATVFIESGDGEGSGFLIHRDGERGYIATNNHVVADAAGGKVNVYFNSGTREERKTPGDVLRTDEDNDVA